MKATALCLAAAILVGCQTTRQVSSNQVAVKTLGVNGADFAYVEDGKGATVVFVHGTCGDWRTWEGVRPSIAKRYHFVALSRRYHFPNAWTDDGSSYTMVQQVEDVAAFIRALDVGKVHLVGASWGGRLVAYLVLKYPELVRSVVMSDPAGLMPPATDEGREAAAAFAKDIAESDAAADRGDAKQAAILRFNAVHGDPAAFQNASAARQERFLDNARTLRPMSHGAAPPPVRCEDLAALRVPAMVMGGDATRANFRFGDEATIACLPKGTATAIIPNAPHMWYPIAPVAGAEAILSFVEKY